MHKILVSAFILTGMVVGAQSIGTSPYASFGLGDVKYDNSLDMNAMGGISAAYIPDYPNEFNFGNPAANFNLELTSFRAQVNNENVFYKSDHNNYKDTKHSTYLSGISLAFPISPKIKFGMNFQPYSSKNYNTQLVNDLGGDVQEVTAFKGEGSVNTVGAALSYQIIDGLGIGFKTNFNFGVISDLQEITYSNAELISGYRTRSSIRSFNHTLGLVYQRTFALDNKFTIGGSYQFGNSGNMNTSYVNSTYYYNGIDRTNETIIEKHTSHSKNLIPQTWQLGIGYGKGLRWFASAQIAFEKGRTINFLGSPFPYDNAYKASIGGWFIPNPNDFRSYFNRVTYRYGAFYEKGALKVNDNNINSYGLTLGANFPIKPNTRSFSSIDLALELGKRGTLKNDLVQEGFINLKIGFNFADRWFMKRVYE